MLDVEYSGRVFHSDGCFVLRVWIVLTLEALFGMLDIGVDVLIFVSGLLKSSVS